jgi:outer membrane lipoprotein SlyB
MVTRIVAALAVVFGISDVANAQRGQAAGVFVQPNRVVLPSDWNTVDRSKYMIEVTYWNIEVVRTNTRIVESRGGQAVKTVGGGALGGGTAVLAGAGPIGVLAGVAVGAGAGALLPDDKKIEEKVACLISVTKPGKPGWTKTYIGTDDAQRCSLAQAGDIMVLKKRMYPGWTENMAQYSFEIMVPPGKVEK